VILGNDVVNDVATGEGCNNITKKNNEKIYSNT
jgi:hypothetical protein